MKKKYVVKLTEGERERLCKLVWAGTAPAQMLNRARVLLKADVGEHAGEHAGEIARRSPTARLPGC